MFQDIYFIDGAFDNVLMMSMIVSGVSSFQSHCNDVVLYKKYSLIIPVDSYNTRGTNGD